jgi:thiol-disulfide isomerase/thioredoxin
MLTLLGCVLLSLAACSGGDQTQAVGGDGQGFVDGDGSVAVIAPDDRLPVNEISGETLDGEPLSVADLEGDVVVLNVWASWCAPCRQEAEGLQGVYEATKDDGVSFVGINTRDQQAAAQAFERAEGITYPSLVDDGGQLLLAFSDTLPPSSIPSTLVLDRQGRLAARILGPTTFTQLKRVVTEVASEGS